jgi:uncharacterized DUF497 family protein
MEFEWDEAKNEANFAKHGFDFEHAIQIFEGPIRQHVDSRLSHHLGTAGAAE